MKKQKTRNLTIAQKTRLLREKFEIDISASTVAKIQRKVLRYSYKRVATFIPKYRGNNTLKSIAFIQKFFETLDNDDKLLVVLDEVGWGTK